LGQGVEGKKKRKRKGTKNNEKKKKRKKKKRKGGGGGGGVGGGGGGGGLNCHGGVWVLFCKARKKLMKERTRQSSAGDGKN